MINAEQYSPQTNEGKKFLTVRDVAEELNFSVRKVWREIEKGHLRVHRFGNSTRVSRGDLDDYVCRARE